MYKVLQENRILNICFYEYYLFKITQITDKIESCFFHYFQTLLAGRAKQKLFSVNIFPPCTLIDNISHSRCN